MDNVEIGRRINTCRQEIGMTVDAVAELVGITKSTVSRYENGSIGKIKMPVIESIARTLGVNPAWIVGKSEDKYLELKPDISPDGQHIGILYDRADEKDKMLTHSVLDKYEDAEKIVAISTKKRNPGGFTELDVYDEPAAAGLGNYLNDPHSRREQFPSYIVPKGADFGVRISGNSMEPLVSDGMTVFVKHTMTVAPSKVGIFILNGAAYCKQLIVDREKQEVRLHSINPEYNDIVVMPEDSLITIGQVL